jgi:hypothetical protein
MVEVVGDFARRHMRVIVGAHEVFLRYDHDRTAVLPDATDPYLASSTLSAVQDKKATA